MANGERTFPGQRLATRLFGRARHQRALGPSATFYERLGLADPYGRASGVAQDESFTWLSAAPYYEALRRAQQPNARQRLMQRFWSFSGPGVHPMALRMSADRATRVGGPLPPDPTYVIPAAEPAEDPSSTPAPRVRPLARALSQPESSTDDWSRMMDELVEASRGRPELQHEAVRLKSTPPARRAAAVSKLTRRLRGSAAPVRAELETKARGLSRRPAAVAERRMSPAGTPSSGLQPVLSRSPSFTAVAPARAETRSATPTPRASARPAPARTPRPMAHQELPEANVVREARTQHSVGRAGPPADAASAASTEPVQAVVPPTQRVAELAQEAASGATEPTARGLRAVRSSADAALPSRGVGLSRAAARAQSAASEAHPLAPSPTRYVRQGSVPSARIAPAMVAPEIAGEPTPQAAEPTGGRTSAAPRVGAFRPRASAAEQPTRSKSPSKARASSEAPRPSRTADAPPPARAASDAPRASRSADTQPSAPTTPAPAAAGGDVGWQAVAPSVSATGRLLQRAAAAPSPDRLSASPTAYVGAASSAGATTASTRSLAAAPTAWLQRLEPSATVSPAPAMTAGGVPEAQLASADSPTGGQAGPSAARPAAWRASLRGQPQPAASTRRLSEAPTAWLRRMEPSASATPAPHRGTSGPSETPLAAPEATVGGEPAPQLATSQPGKAQPAAWRASMRARVQPAASSRRLSEAPTAWMRRLEPSGPSAAASARAMQARSPGATQPPMGLAPEQQLVTRPPSSEGTDAPTERPSAASAWRAARRGQATPSRGRLSDPPTAWVRSLDRAADTPPSGTVTTQAQPPTVAGPASAVASPEAQTPVGAGPRAGAALRASLRGQAAEAPSKARLAAAPTEWIRTVTPSAHPTDDGPAPAARAFAETHAEAPRVEARLAARESVGGALADSAEPGVRPSRASTRPTLRAAARDQAPTSRAAWAAPPTAYVHSEPSAGADPVAEAHERAPSLVGRAWGRVAPEVRHDDRGAALLSSTSLSSTRTSARVLDGERRMLAQASASTGAATPRPDRASQRLGAVARAAFRAAMASGEHRPTASGRGVLPSVMAHVAARRDLSPGEAVALAQGRPGAAGAADRRQPGAARLARGFTPPGTGTPSSTGVPPTGVPPSARAPGPPTVDTGALAYPELAGAEPAAGQPAPGAQPAPGVATGARAPSQVAWLASRGAREGAPQQAGPQARLGTMAPPSALPRRQAAVAARLQQRGLAAPGELARQEAPGPASGAELPWAHTQAPLAVAPPTGAAPRRAGPWGRSAAYLAGGQEPTSDVPGAQPPGWAARAVTGSAVPSAARDAQEPRRLRPRSQALLTALARADRPDEVVQVIMERSAGIRALSQELPAPTARLIERIASAGQQAATAAPSTEDASLPGAPAAGQWFGRSPRARRPSMTTGATRVRGFASSSGVSSQGRPGVGASQVTKLARRLMKLIHLAEVERRVQDAQKQVRMAEDTAEARAEGSAGPGGASESEAVNIKALQREVLEGVLHELELTQIRRQEDSDGNWW